MTQKLPVVSGQELIKVLANFGFIVERIKGSHAILKNRNFMPPIVTVIPLHKELDIGTLKSALRQAGISEEAFLEKYNQ